MTEIRRSDTIMVKILCRKVFKIKENAHDKTSAFLARQPTLKY